MIEQKSAQELYDELLDDLMRREEGLDLHGPLKRWSVREAEMPRLFDGYTQTFSHRHKFGIGYVDENERRIPGRFYIVSLLRKLAEMGMFYKDGAVTASLSSIIHTTWGREAAISKAFRDAVSTEIAIQPNPTRYRVNEDGSDPMKRFRQFVGGSFPVRTQAIAIPDTGLSVVGMCGNSEAAMAALRVLRFVLEGKVVAYRSGDNELTREYQERVEWAKRVGPWCSAEVDRCSGQFLVLEDSSRSYAQIPFEYSSDKPMSNTLEPVIERAYETRREFLGA